MRSENGWTPYGLEAIRRKHIRRRRLMAVGLFFAYIVGYSLFVIMTTSSSLSVTDAEGKSTVELELPKNEETEQKPITVAIGQGRMVMADFGGETPSISPTPPTPAYVDALHWRGELTTYGPLLAVLWLLLTALRSRDKNAEVNYGVYKGALPYEMITAEAKGFVLTTKHAKESLFGRTREDYVPGAPVARVPEGER
jgi:hypothetical protein